MKITLPLLLSVIAAASPLFSARTNAQDAPEILTPPSPPAAQIHGPKIFGVRPNHPFLFTIPATGTRPITFSADNLPDGLSLDGSTGQITGTIKGASGPDLFHIEYNVTLHAKNAAGESSRPFKIVVGDTICLTPPMGWNSWNCWAVAVDQEKVAASAKAMVEKGLINHGWSYINIDDTWQGQRGGQFNGIQPNEKFPNIKSLADQIHGMGLKIGIYSTPWMTSYAGYVGGSSNDEGGKWTLEDNGGDNAGKFRQDGPHLFAKNDAQQWAAWGIDYLKYDWNPKSPKNADFSPPFKNQVKDMADALNGSGRDIVYSYSNSFPIESAAEVTPYLNCWRTTGDIRDTWWSLTNIWNQQGKWNKYELPGHFNDPDMLVVGYVGWGPKLHPSGLTPHEQYTHISLWALLGAPMLIGCDMTRLDDFTLGLLTNDEVIDIDQDTTGKSATLIYKDGEVSIMRPGTPPGAKPYVPGKMPAKQIWAKDLEDGSKAIGLFNLTDTDADITLNFNDAKLAGPQTIRDVWRQQNIASATGSYTAKVAPHGVVLLKLTPVQGK